MTESPSNIMAVDGSCLGNPGVIEYRGIDIETQQELFRWQYPIGTNNIAEYLAIVHGIKYYYQNGIKNGVILSDSQTAIAWFKKKAHNSNFEISSDASNKLVGVLDRADQFLRDTPFDTIVVKWNSEWGENPADFGRKGNFFRTIYNIRDRCKEIVERGKEK